MPALASRVALALVSLVVTFGAAELLLRTLGPSTHATDRRDFHELRPDRPWLYGMIPGARGNLPISGEIVYQINADGFRDDLYERPKPADTFRILVLGDSVAFGYGVEMEATFPKRMEASLAAATRQPRFEVLNLGVSGYNPFTEAALLRDLLPRYQPDLVLVQFCINDLNDPTLHFDVQTRQHLGAIPDAAYPDPAKRRAPASPPGLLLRLCRSSSVCSRIDDTLLAATAVDPGTAQQEAAAVPVERGDGPHWQWLSGLYAEMAAKSRAAGAEFAVIAFPYPRQLGTDGQQRVRDEIVALGEHGGWLVIDPLESFRAASRHGQPLFLDWWHPSPRGHRLAARESLRQLACAGLLPETTHVLCND